MRVIIGWICFAAIAIPGITILGILVLIGEGAQWIADEWMYPLLDRIERWMDADLRSEVVDRPGRRD